MRIGRSGCAVFALWSEHVPRYAFEVDPSANKIQVKNAVEELFKVKVDEVRLFNVRGKMKRMGRWEGKRRDWRKAYVRLKEGEKAPDFIEGV